MTDHVAAYRAARRDRAATRIAAAESRLDASLGALGHTGLGDHRANATAGLVRMYRGAGLAKRPRRVMPRQAHPSNIARDYARVLRGIVGRLADALAPLLEELPRLVESAAAEHGLRGDGADVARLDAGEWHEAMRFDARYWLVTDEAPRWWATAERLDAGEGKRVRDLVGRARATVADQVGPGAARSIAERFGQQVSDFQKKQLGRQLQAALGVNPLVHERPLDAIMEHFNESNVGLIQDLTDLAASQVERVTLHGMQVGRRHEDIARDVQGRLSVARGRAQLIARDQVGKLAGQVNAARQRSLGVTRFTWRTVGDQRVRDEHDERDGEVYDYSDPPDGELPGEPINCRCSAEPILDDIEALLDDSADSEN